MIGGYLPCYNTDVFRLLFNYTLGVTKEAGVELIHAYGLAR